MIERNANPAAPAPINLGNISKGAALEAFAHELVLVLDNIADLSTPATAKRSITLKVDFEPQADRIKVDTTLSTITKLAGVEARAGQMFIARREGGGFVALDQDPRQMTLWPAPAPIESMPPDKFLIDFRASFYWNDEAVKVATVLSHLESAHSVTVADDGLSQKLEITQETRAVQKIPITLPAEGVPLIPWRTFREAVPVESRFLLPPAIDQRCRAECGVI